MKIVKISLLLIVGLLAVLLIAAALVPNSYTIKKDIVISKGKSDVFNYLKYIKNMDNFSVWAKIDPNMKKTYQGTDGQVGFIAAWQSDHEKVGKGEQEIIAITDGERIDTEIRFLEPFEAVDKAYFTTQSVSYTETRVTWGFEGNVPYPWALMLLLMDMEQELGLPLATSLANLKTLLEK